MSALVGGVCGRRDHLVRDRGLRQLIRRHVEFDDLVEASIPLHLVAVDLTERCELLLSDGPAVDAVAASASIPGVFPPVEMAERRLVNGGAVNNTPISHAVELGAERIYVLPTRRASSRHPWLRANVLAAVPDQTEHVAKGSPTLAIGSRAQLDLVLEADAT